MALIWLACFAGCQNDASSTLTSAVPQPAPRVLAQGQLLPAGGIVRLSATPGDVVHELKVDEVGRQVEAGTELVVMRSAVVREKELDALDARLEAARQEKQQAVAQAQRQVRIAQAKLENVHARIEALPRQEALLELAQNQLQASERVLSKLEAIAADQLTKEFIGGMEVDRQRIAVEEARLKYKQQQESFLQSKQDLEFTRQAAELELQAAQDVHAAAQQSAAPSVIEAQIASLREQLELSRISAPVTGSILAINVQPGEASAQMPLVEMADLSQLVCEVEVNEIDAAKVKVGQRAIITSRAFSESIEGVVEETHALVGQPVLRSMDPLARTDYHTRTAVIRLCDSSLARQWLQLQVQVEILTSETGNCAADPVGASSPLQPSIVP